MKSKEYHKTLLLTGADIQRIIAYVGIHEIMDHLIKEMEFAILNYNPSITQIPIRSGFNYQLPIEGLVEWMPLYDTGKEVVLKCVGYHPQNPEQFGLPTILSTISSFDTDTGHLQVIMDCTLLTSIRTGVASAVASKALSRQDANTLGVIGCGAQAITQIHAISRVFDLKKIFFFDNDIETSETLLDRLEVLNLHCELERASIEKILASSDIVCTATSIDVGSGPLFEDLSTLPHLHVNAVGSDFPGKIELPLKLLNRALVVPDFKQQATIEGECQQLKQEQIGPELFAIIQDISSYKEYQDKLTVFDSTGWSLEDYVGMKFFRNLAHELGIGEWIEIESIPNDAKNPYEFLTEFAPSLVVAAKKLQ